ncbi:uncharacterized protein LOC132309358 [Cornus florida]|uniref:uncharacterized protein LOC132309358 n=1 Tax=Cornus florida TaxID=4283 RepID=UPI0028978658|nr:uncharacterized protein LOC132309358 [Cornus florida]
MNAFSQPQQFLSMLEAMITKQLEPTNQLVQSHSQSLAKLETQVGQLAQALNRREDGKILSQPVANQEAKINLPLLDAIQQIPAYAKFLKDMCTQKRRSNSHVPKKVLLTEQVSSIIQHCTAPKFKDPSAPTISCTIGNHQVERALLDLGASVNLLPYSVYLQLGLGELKPTSTILELADRSTKQPRGVIEDVIIKVDKFYFPVDFIVLDTEPVLEPRRHIPVRLNIFNASNCPSDDKDCFLVDSIDKCVEEMAPFALKKDPLEACLSYFDAESFDVEKNIKEVNVILDGANMHNIPPWKIPIEPLLPLSSEPPTPSLKSPPKLELKSLPSHLKNAYLGPENTLPLHNSFSDKQLFQLQKETSPWYADIRNWKASRKKTVRLDRKDWYIEDFMPTERV